MIHHAELSMHQSPSTYWLNNQHCSTVLSHLVICSRFGRICSRWREIHHVFVLVCSRLDRQLVHASLASCLQRSRNPVSKAENRNVAARMTMLRKATTTVILVIMLTVLATTVLAHVENVADTTAYTIDPNRRQAILNASIRIVMYGPARIVEITNDNGATEQATSRKQYNGIGTVVNVNGEHRIVTHDHWPTMSDARFTIQMLDAWGTVLTEMSGPEFAQLLRYRDGGTVVLLTPQTVSDAVEPFQWHNETDASVGDIVYVARQHPTLDNIIDVVVAQVEVDRTHNGRQTVDLRTLNGDVIIPGDSGGGVWLDGQLVGNMWSTKINVAADGNGGTVATTGCIAAELAVEMLVPMPRATNGENAPAFGGYQIDG